nr:ABC transporter permease [Microlunatus panaciterrae]
MGHGLTEAKLLVRNGEQLLVALVIPIGVLVAGRLLAGRLGEMQVLAPSVLALAIWSSAFTSTAIATGFERRYGVLERLAATPLRRSGLLAGKGLSVGLVLLGQLVVLSTAAVLLGWRPLLRPVPTLLALVLVLLAVSVFCCLALALAGSLRAEATLALANLIYLLLAGCGGLVLPVERYPGWAQPVLEWLPTAALGEGLRSWSSGHAPVAPLGVLALWLVVAGLTAWRKFRWTS